MCGILALLQRNGQPVDAGLTARMRDTMSHRGPDDVGLLVDGPVALAHRRLAIVDLTVAGHNPMSNEDGTVWITFNGEIYNYLELAAGLARRGHQFRSHTDTEVIVHLYEEHGVGCLEYLVGMFGFALWDSRKQQLFVARDRIGIKPVYYYDSLDRFICSSEIKGILEDPAVSRRVDYQAMADYVFCGQFLGGKTPFAAIRELPAGHYLVATREQTRIARYWDLAFAYDRDRSWERTIEETTALLDDAVRLHCRSDAPVGCHLSGGLDSSTVTSFAARYRPGIPAFAIRFPDINPKYDESRYARAVTEATGARYVEGRPVAEDFWRQLSSLIWHMDTPLFGTGAFSYYTVSSLAARSVKVTLTGHGGDEVFAGYPAQFQAAFGTTDMFEPPVPTAPEPRLARLLRLLRRGPVGLWQAAGARLQRFHRMAGAAETLDDLWVRLHCGSWPALRLDSAPEFLRQLDGYSPVDDYLAPLRQAPTDETLDRCLYHDLTSYLPSLLQQEDRVSMAVSLESRVPLLDHRLVEHMGTVPPEQKARGREPKVVLRASARGTVPDVVLDRKDKIPFRTPMDAWFRGPLWPMVREILDSPQARSRGIYRTSGWKPEAHARDLWSRLSVEIWHRIFIDQNPDWVGLTQSAGQLAGAAFDADPARG